MNNIFNKKNKNNKNADDIFFEIDKTKIFLEIV